MMGIQMKVLLIAMASLVVFASIGPVYAVVIGDWESGSGDGCIDWGSGESIETTTTGNAAYTLGATVGVTSGVHSLLVEQSGYAQSLSFQLDAAGKTAFMNNSVFSVDITVPASGGVYTAGYTNIEEVAMNAPGAGFTAVASGTPLQFYWWGSAGERTETLVIDYSAFREAVTATDYIEIVFTLNTGGGAPDEIYFDNAQLYGGTGTVGSYEDEVLSDSPVLYLRLEEDTAIGGAGNGPQIDSSGNGNWAGHRADTEFVAGGGIGNCRYLPDVDNQNMIAAGNTTEFDWTFDFSDDQAFAPDDITFEFWFNTTASTPSDANGLDPYGVFFQQVKAEFYQAPGMSNSDGTLRILSGDPNAAEVAAGAERWWYTNVTAPLDGEWHQAVVTYQESYGTADEMAIQLYLDGVLEASTVVGDATRPAKLGPEFDHVCIGGANDLGWSYSNYEGLIDEFAIYAGVLSADRIGVHYGAGMCAMSQGDLTGDCKVDMADFAAIAATWLQCNDPALIGSDDDCIASW